MRVHASNTLNGCDKVVINKPACTLVPDCADCESPGVTFLGRGCSY